MNILIVDDTNDKIVDVVSAIKEVSNDINIETARDIVGARTKLSNYKFDILICDLLLPLSKESLDLLPEGGKLLVNEIVRKNQLIAPKYIVGLTQHEEYEGLFSKIWNVIIYSPSEISWKEKLQEILFYSLRTYENTEEVKYKLPTLFVEGKTDKQILDEAIDLYYTDKKGKISIECEDDGGASWVTRQIVIWANSLNKGEDGEYVKSVGLLDGDPPGNEAKKEINNKVDGSSAGSPTFKVFQLTPTYARDIIPLVTKGVVIPVTLEETFGNGFWNHAKNKGWLEKRQDPDSFLKEPKNWDKFNQSLGEHIETLGLNENEKLYLNKVNKFKKEDCVKYVVGLNGEEKSKALENACSLLKDIFEYLGV